MVAGAAGNAGVQQSMSNLVAQSAAHLLYAADWNGRQVTHNPDDLGVYQGDVAAYNAANCSGDQLDPDCHPPLIAGLGPTSNPNLWLIWAYWSTFSNAIMLQPINFPGPPNDSSGSDGWGWFRFGVQPKPFQDYLNGRYQDPIYYAPKDRDILDHLEPCF